MENKKFRSGSCFAKHIAMLPDRFLFQNILVTRLFTYKTVRQTTIFNLQFSVFNLHKKLSYHRNCIGMTQQVCVFTHSCRCVAGFLPFTVFRQHPYHMLRQ